MYRVVGSSLSSLDKDRGRWILSRRARCCRCQPGRRRPRTTAGVGRSSTSLRRRGRWSFDSVTLPHLVDEGYGIETEDRGHIRLGGFLLRNRWVAVAIVNHYICALNVYRIPPATYLRRCHFGTCQTNSTSHFQLYHPTLTSPLNLPSHWTDNISSSPCIVLLGIPSGKTIPQNMPSLSHPGDAGAQ